MRDLNNWERKIVQHLSALQPGISMDMIGFLNSFFFKRSMGQALILNAQARYAMFFMPQHAYFDQALRKDEISRFLNLFSFLKYLSTEGYLSFHPIENGTEAPVYYIQDSFDKIINSHAQPVTLNTLGDCLSASDTILTKDKKPFCKGVIFEYETYDLIAKTTISGFILTKDLAELGQAATGLKTSASKMSAFSAGLALVILLGLTGFFFTFHVRMEDQHQQLAQLLQSHKEISNNLQQLRAATGLSAITESSTVVQRHFGIDVSKWNGNILTDLDKADSITFVICKATEGETYIDPDFETNSKFLKEKKVIWGFYHFFHTGDDPIKQAEFFLEVTGKEPGAITPIVDIEQESLPEGASTSATKIQVDLLLFLTHLERAIGRVPMIYTDEAFANEYLNNESFAKYPLWLAEYINADEPTIPLAWKDKGFKIWQKSASYSLDSRATDLDVFFGNVEELPR